MVKQKSHIPPESHTIFFVLSHLQ